MFSMKRLDTGQRVRIVRALVEGCSLRATARMTGVSLNTVMKFLADFGPVCQRFHDERVTNLDAVERVQADEVWSFCGSKQKNVPLGEEKNPNYGSVWTWTALCADTKLMVNWYVGGRDAACAGRFMRDLAGRLANRVQLTTDGHHVYERAVEAAFGWGGVDYAMLVKIYGENRDAEARYSPCECLGTKKMPVMGQPVKEDVSTSFVERQNLTLRMSNRRFTRLTNAFSRRIRNLKASLAIHYCYYNWCRIHQSLRVTPAMEAGIADRVWDIADLVALMEAEEAAVVGTEANKRGPYRKRA